MASNLRYFPTRSITILQDVSSRLFCFTTPKVVQRLLYGYLAALVGYLVIVQLAIPIIMTDTDIWYHLNGGRYFWAMGKLQNTSFFSYLEPLREWTNYFWGFQAIVFKVFDLFGNQGLVVFRTLLFTLTVSVILAFIFADRKAREHPAMFLVLVTLLVIILSGRAIAVRPHLVSYLSIVFFIHVLQNRPRLAPLLPLIAACWVNLHGVEWVVGALICGAYLLEHISSRWCSGVPWYGLDTRYVISILACPLALFLNPHGMGILNAPFAHEPELYLFINELQQVNLSILHSFIFSLTELSVSASVTMLAMMAVASAITLIVLGRLRISHAIMAIGGAYLFFKGVRFIWEWALLSFPLVHAALMELASSRKKSPKIRLWRLVVVAYFAVMPFASLALNFDKYPNYPFEPEGLPVGTMSFLERNDAKGRILADPGIAGYIQWALYPELLIHSDMEFPPFRAIDMYTATWALRNTYVMDALLRIYSIDFIEVGLTNTAFQTVVADHAQFVPVFFDDSYVLYANRDTQAALVSRFALKVINPYDLLASSDTGDRAVDERINELKRIAAIYPDARRVNHALTWLLFDQKRYSEALEFAEKYVILYPKDPNSHYWVGNVLENLDRCDEAIPHFKESLRYADIAFTPILKRHLGTCAYLQKNFDEAFALFSESINPYLRKEDSNDLYQYAYSAAATGDIEKAIKILDILLLAVDPDNKALKIKAQAFRDDISSGELAGIGIVSWLRSLLN